MRALRAVAQRAVRAAASKVSRTDVYYEDGLLTTHNHDFVVDPDFMRAYGRGAKAAREDYHWRWRVHVGLWAARAASKLPGDFVECGVNRGFLSSAIMDLLDWDRLGKNFWLLDTFDGIDETVLPAAEREFIHEHHGRLIESGYYVHDADSVRENFSKWSNVRIIEGSVPGTLEQVTAEQVAFLHLDMNSSTPEVAALDFFWDRLADGALVVLDDYAYQGYTMQKDAMDALARRRSVAIASLPTGQGLLLRPPAP